MKRVNSISGGQTSAYMAAHHKADSNLFALVCIDDKKCAPADKRLVQKVNDKINSTGCLNQFGEFIATAEDDKTLTALFELEQFLGQEIKWVRGISFDKLIEQRKYVPNKIARFCTSEMKIRQLFSYCYYQAFSEPVEVNIGFRANEGRRVANTLSKTNDDGLSEFKHAYLTSIVTRRQKLTSAPWQKPCFPLHDNRVYKDEIVNFWKGKPVGFPPLNNCIGCYWRNEILLKKMYEAHEDKMDWFAEQEKKVGGTFRTNITYKQIKQSKLQLELSFDDFRIAIAGIAGYKKTGESFSLARFKI